ncbi:cell division cycle-associated protein 3 isoform X2 [Amphiprion ocellaris]|uniref:cell division cycle-associated protein 3 isoform X2 n=1 Tax=Amphiprion ocellaris TaxID=80972 RepID=UPI00241161EC|nr:cell division cycle-associated protein 3 isoform X2 [Amphiprion ocellaris]
MLAAGNCPLIKLEEKVTLISIMGSSESKMPAAIKPEPAVKKSHVSHLIDPRSPSTGISRTPIQIGAFVSKTSDELKSENSSTFSDPRSPTIGISRTPVRDVMTATVGSFARRLGLLFHSETQNNQKTFMEEELPSTEPLLNPKHLNTPVLQNLSDLSPFVILEEPQVEVEVETEADMSLEEATESPLHKRLSLSLITCHEGTTSSTVLAEVHHEGSSFAEPTVEVDAVEHSYALPSVSVEAEPPETSVPSAEEGSPAPSEEPEPEPASADATELTEEPQPPCSSAVPSTGIRCPTFDPRSPSQVVFKPQWLGKGFSAPGVRSRAVHAGKGGSSPLAVRVAVKNVTNENKGHCGKPKQKGSEGRSPLQILKETNSPRDQRSQMKLKVSTPDKQRSGPTGRRVLVSLDKENQ